MRKVVLAVGVVEALGFAGYALAILGIGLSQEQTPSAPAVEAAIYLIFAGLLGLVVWPLSRGSNVARTPYFLAQLFGLIISYTLIMGDGTSYQVAGGAIGILSILGIVGFIKS